MMARVFENERPLKSNLQRLAKLQRVLARKVQGSKNYEKIKAKIRQVHARIRHIRDDVLQKLTTSIAKKYGFVATEDLNVQGMTKNHRLAQSLQDASSGTIAHLYFENKVTSPSTVFLSKSDAFSRPPNSVVIPDCDWTTVSDLNL